MSITNLLARGFDPMPAGGQANALMQVQQLRAGQQRNLLLQQQMQAAQAEQALAQRNALLGQQWREGLEVPQGTTTQVPGMPAMNAAQAESAVGSPGYGASSAQDRTEFVPPDPRQVAAVKMAKANQMTPAALFEIMNPKPDAYTLAPGAQRYEGGRMVNQNPVTQKASQDEFMARMIAANIDPQSPEGRAMLLDKLRKESTHAPAPSFNNYGTPLPIDLGGGKTGYLQPPTRPGAPTQVLQIPGTNAPAIKPATADSAASEDERKAAGWLAQADNAWKNMQKVAFDAGGELTPSASPGIGDAVASIPGMSAVGNTLRSADRQKFVQASSSLSEALLRAATGAGVNRDEAVQKVQELTPGWGERAETTKQKFEAVPIYLRALRDRAGRAIKAQPAASGAGNDDPLGLRGGK